MDISAEKLNIIDIPKRSQLEWWDNITKDEQDSVDRGLSDLKKGKVFTHLQARERYEKYLND